jgi:hypothetical protein
MPCFTAADPSAIVSYSQDARFAELAHGICRQDAIYGSATVQVVGSLSELGNWNVEHGLPLHFDTASRAFVGSTVVGSSRELERLYRRSHACLAHLVLQRVLTQPPLPWSSNTRLPFSLLIPVRQPRTHGNGSRVQIAGLPSSQNLQTYLRRQ